jgi:hypothetical protein
MAAVWKIINKKLCEKKLSWTFTGTIAVGIYLEALKVLLQYEYVWRL